MSLSFLYCLSVSLSVSLCLSLSLSSLSSLVSNLHGAVLSLLYEKLFLLKQASQHGAPAHFLFAGTIFWAFAIVL